MHVSAEVVDTEQEWTPVDVYDVDVDQLSGRDDVLTLQSLAAPLIKRVRLAFRAVLALFVYNTGVGDVLSAYRAVGELRRVRGCNQSYIAGMVEGYVDRGYNCRSTALFSYEEHGPVVIALRFVYECIRQRNCRLRGTLASAGRIQEVECTLCSDLVELVRGVLVKLEQQAIVLVHNGYERVVLVGDVSMPIILDDSHGDEIVLVLWCIDDRATIGMVSDLVKAASGVADTVDSVLCRSNVSQ